ncbi:MULTISPECIES: WS/DGAT domain-containing protein [unclassified Marinobacter]|uniref:WS/DGAT domain-containing protein n=1 Tax=unclassified Marinobacter TaxID=83889 RepID=UPI000BF9907F|nr:MULTISPECIES: WS/DGAT domain-containing protein [unclassified Marinobacter]PFG11078.1 WS/DGAT/MGAT family acyltransferase [Marinobacter sp. LV10MA510-1]PFG52970.1 WS/DGAT/MGAT family acyltransferase [Marinobacter sp. LV10R520-4]
MSQQALHLMLPADAGWLAAERPENPLVTTVLLRVQGLTAARLREFLHVYWGAWERFRFRPEPYAGYWRWQESADFDVRQHLDIVLDRFTAPQQQPWINTVISQPLPIYRPLWKFWLAPNAVGGGLLLIRIHHCYADSASLAQLLEQLFTASPQQHPVLYGAAHPADLERWLQCAKNWLSERVFGAESPPPENAESPPPETDAVQTAAAAGQLPGTFSSSAATALELAGQLGSYLAQPDDSPSNLSRPLTGQRQCCWSAAIPDARLQAAAQTLGVSSRDVLAACITAALQAQLGLSPQALEQAQINLLLPVDVRSQLPASLRPALSEPGNGSGSERLLLPIDGDSFVERVYRIKQEVRRLRDSLQPLLTWGLTACSGFLPEMIKQTPLWPFAARPSAALASFDGAGVVRYLAGCRVDELVAWSPQVADAGVSVTACRYAGQLRLTVVADHSANLDVQRFQSDCMVALTQALASQLDN